MKIGLFDVDSTIPNLALMKISSYYKTLGHDVEFAMPLQFDDYDKIYASKIFNFKHENDAYLRFNDPNFIIGGTGVNVASKLPTEIEECNPDYSLYGIDYNIGFASRGCRKKCLFCVVPEKEGKIYSVSSIGKLLTNPKSTNLMLLDNDFFGNPQWEQISKELIESGIKVNISQGINIRSITDKQAICLSRINYRDIHFNRKSIHVAWDNIKDENLVIHGLERLMSHGILASHITVYVLIGFNSTPDEDMYRVEKLRRLKVSPFVMPFDKNDPYQRDFTRYVNNKAVFKSIPFEEYGMTRMTSREKRVHFQHSLLEYAL